MALINAEDAAKRLARVILSDIELYRRERPRAGETLESQIEEGRKLFRSRVIPSLVPLFGVVLADRRAATDSAAALAGVPATIGGAPVASPKPAGWTASADSSTPAPTPLPEVTPLPLPTPPPTPAPTVGRFVDRHAFDASSGLTPAPSAHGVTVAEAPPALAASPPPAAAKPAPILETPAIAPVSTVAPLAAAFDDEATPVPGDSAPSMGEAPTPGPGFMPTPQPRVVASPFPRALEPAVPPRVSAAPLVANRQMSTRAFPERSTPGDPDEPMREAPTPGPEPTRTPQPRVSAPLPPRGFEPPSPTHVTAESIVAPWPASTALTQAPSPPPYLDRASELPIPVLTSPISIARLVAVAVVVASAVALLYRFLG